MMRFVKSTVDKIILLSVSWNIRLRGHKYGVLTFYGDYVRRWRKYGKNEVTVFSFRIKIASLGVDITLADIIFPRGIWGVKSLHRYKL